MSDEPLYCRVCGREECACPGEWPGDGPYCHVCGVIPAPGKSCDETRQPCEVAQ